MSAAVPFGFFFLILFLIQTNFLIAQSQADILKEEGNTAFAQRNYHAALGKFDAAIALDPQNHLLYSNRSATYARLNDFSKVSSCDSLSIALCSDDSYRSFNRRLLTPTPRLPLSPTGARYGLFFF